MIRRAALLLLVGMACSAPAAAQVAVGDSVRMRITGQVPVEAMTVGVRNDILILRTAGIASEWPVSMFDMEHLQIHRLRTSQEGFRRGFGLGLAGGVFAGAAIGLVLHATGATAASPTGDPARVISTTLLFTGLGAIGGAFVGGFMGGANPGHGWVSIPLPARR